MTQVLCAPASSTWLTSNTQTVTHPCTRHLLLAKQKLFGCKFLTMLSNVRKYAFAYTIFTTHLPSCGSFMQYLLSALTRFLYRLERQCRRWTTSRGQSTSSRWTRRSTSQMMSSEIDIGWVISWKRSKVMKNHCICRETLCPIKCELVKRCRNLNLAVRNMPLTADDLWKFILTTKTSLNSHLGPNWLMDFPVGLM